MLCASGTCSFLSAFADVVCPTSSIEVLKDSSPDIAKVHLDRNSRVGTELHIPKLLFENTVWFDLSDNTEGT